MPYVIAIGRDIDEVARLRREDVGRVAVRSGPPRSSNADEADAAFDDQRVVAGGDDVAEAHPADRVGRQPRLHADVDRDAVDRRRVRRNGTVCRRDEQRARAGDARRPRRSRRRAAATGRAAGRARCSAPCEIRRVEAQIARRLQHAEHVARAGRQIARRVVDAGAARRRADRARSAAAVRTRPRRSRARARSATTSRPMARLSRDERRRVEQRRPACRATASSGRLHLGEVREAVLHLPVQIGEQDGAPIVEAGGQRREDSRPADRRRFGRAPGSRDTRAQPA